MFLRRIVVGSFQANCYIIADEKKGEGLIIDPGGDAGLILNVVKRNKLRIIYIIATHAHIDHIADAVVVKESTGAKFLLHSLDAPFLNDPNLNLSFFLDTPCTLPSPDRLLQEGENLKIGDIEIKILHTPGHTPGSISLEAGECIFTGDTLFAQGVGRVDLPGGDFKALQMSIREKIFSLPDKTKVFPGHGPETFIAKEKRENPFV